MQEKIKNIIEQTNRKLNEIRAKNKTFNIEEAVKSFQIDFVDLAKLFFENQPFFYDKVRNWWLWDFDKCCWVIVDKTDLFNKIYDSCKIAGITITNNSTKAEMTTALEMVGRQKIPKDVPLNWIQFREHIYNLDTGETFKATPEYFNTNPIPHNIGTSDETPVIERLFEEWVGVNYVKTLYQIIAYCLYKDYPLHRIFVLIGSGNNGKTCFLRLLKIFLGGLNCSSSELDSLLERFGTTVLYKKLCCLMGETNFNQLKKTSLLKKISGNDLIDFEFKGRDRHSGLNYAKLIIATNSLPSTLDKTDGFYRRPLIINFGNKFSEKKDVINEIPAEEFNNLCLKSIKILKELLQQREFYNEGTIEQRKERYEKFSNPVMNFVKEKCVVGPNYEIPVFQFYESFLSYCKARGIRELNNKEVTQILNNEGFESKQIHITEKGISKNWRHYIGLKLKETIIDFSKNVTDVTDVTLNPTHSLYKEQIEKRVTSVTSVTNTTKILFSYVTGLPQEIEVVYEKLAKSHNITRDQFDEALDKLLFRGDVYKPHHNLIAKL